MPATSRNTTTRPYGSSRGSETNWTPAAASARSGIGSLHTQEQPDAARELVADGLRLAFAVGAGEQEPGAGSRRADDDPALRAAAGGGQRRRVLDELEAEGVDEEGDRRVVVVDDQREVLQVHEVPVRT